MQITTLIQVTLAVWLLLLVGGGLAVIGLIRGFDKALERKHRERR